MKAQQSRSLEEKVVLVTGAGSSIGRATAIVVASAGANVIASDISKDAVQETVSMICSDGGNASVAVADVGSEENVKQVIETVVEKYGRLDGAFNNAAIAQCGKPLHELTTSEWERTLRIDLSSVFWCMKYQIGAMLKTGGGAIVNTASSLGQVAIPLASEYVAAKHGVIGLTRAAAADYGASNIRVNAVLPGIIKTPLVNQLANDPQFAAFLGKLKDRHPIGRFGDPREIGEAVAWLLSDAASFVNGAAMPVDGGYLAV